MESTFNQPNGPAALTDANGLNHDAMRAIARTHAGSTI